MLTSETKGGVIIKLVENVFELQNYSRTTSHLIEVVENAPVLFKSI